MSTPEDRQLVEKLKDLRNKVNWNIEEERFNFLLQLYLLGVIDHRIPAVHLFLHPGEIQRLLWDSLNYKDEENAHMPGDLFIEMAAANAYKDEPEVDENGIISPRRTTLIHRAVKKYEELRLWNEIVPLLFDICGKFDVNYTDESGYTHFHAACQFNCPEIVRGFLEHGQDPNCIWPETGDTALHIALSFAWTNDIMILLLRAGANPNSANKKGLTPLHIIAKEDYDCEIIKLFFQINDELNQLVQINARDESGNTPIHLALKYFDEQELVEIMLRRGASPNSANDEGSTPLHIICKRDIYYRDDWAEYFFKINEELNQRVQVDARDKLDRTPLQCAVVSGLPYAVESLLNHGADLSSFVFPTSSQFNDCFKSDCYNCIKFKLRLAIGFLAVIECLEKRGYELDRSDALIIMKLFDKNKLFEAMEDLNERWYDDKKFAKKARKKMVKPDLSLYDLIHLRPHDAVKRLTYMGCYDLVKPDEWWLNSLKTNLANEACCRYLCEMMSRKFFRSWALEPFWKLIHYRLPLECCEMVLENLQNKDLYHIFLAAEGRTDKDGKINVKFDVKLLLGPRHEDVAAIVLYVVESAERCPFGRMTWMNADIYILKTTITRVKRKNPFEAKLSRRLGSQGALTQRTME
ncbi:unnamed protein product [Trichogramma brassicae]|uniref:Uncharacterized protein n=1 Tax=Trichogramma brassicae TaxID=86971 RepID=A0A6H5J450_9HYME|nr:unnamed protein product [Trichogramma brassicae]